MEFVNNILDISGMPLPNIILMTGAAILVLTVLFRITKKLFRFIAIVAIGLVVFSLWTGKDFKGVVDGGVDRLLMTKDVSSMLDNCTGEKAEKFMCKCVYEPIYTDLASKHGTDGLRLLDQNTSEKKREIKAAYQNKKSTILDCLKERRRAGGGKLIDGTIDYFKNLDLEKKP